MFPPFQKQHIFTPPSEIQIPWAPQVCGLFMHHPCTYHFKHSPPRQSLDSLLLCISGKGRIQPFGSFTLMFSDKFRLRWRVFWPLSGASLPATWDQLPTCKGFVMAHCPTRAPRCTDAHTGQTHGAVGSYSGGLQQSRPFKGGTRGLWIFRPKASSQCMCTVKEPTSLSPQTAICQRLGACGNLFPALATDGEGKARALVTWSFNQTQCQG